MPNLRRFIGFLESAGCALPPGIEEEIRRAFPGERLYIPPVDSRRDPGRKESIIHAAARLPTRVVAERHGVSESWVRQVVKTKR